MFVDDSSYLFPSLFVCLYVDGKHPVIRCRGFSDVLLDFSFLQT